MRTNIKRFGAMAVATLFVAGSAYAGNQMSLSQAQRGNDRPSMDRAPSAPTPEAVIYNNGDTDGTNGYSQGTTGAFGIRRTTLDDFTVGAVTINEMSWFHVWGSGGGPKGTDAEILIRSDASGTPGPVIATATTCAYEEVGTNRNWFGRQEMLSTVAFDDIVLAAGTYWVDWTIVGPENDFVMVKSTLTGAECWVDYADFGFLPGTAVFGVAADLNFILTDEGVCGAGGGGGGGGDCDLTEVNAKLDFLESKVDLLENTDLTEINNKLDFLESKVDLLEVPDACDVVRLIGMIPGHELPTSHPCYLP